MLAPPLDNLPNYLIVGRNVAGGYAMLERINKAIVDATNDGSLAKIKAKYDQ